MNVYLDIAQSNPEKAYEICKSYGFYQMSTIEEIADALQDVVATEGEQGFAEIVKLHPLYEPIIEVHMKADNKDCGCKKNLDGAATVTATQQPAQPQPSSNKLFEFSSNQTNTAIIIGAVIVALAVIAKSK